MAFFSQDQLKEIVQFLKAHSKELGDVILNDAKLRADLQTAVVDEIVKRLRNG